jgi:hypothetical protein
MRTIKKMILPGEVKMKRLLFVTAIFICGSFLFCFQVYAGGKLWVSSDGAKLKEARSSSSTTLKKLALGTELDVLGFEKRWYRVTTPSGREGWIYRGKVSKKRVGKEGPAKGNNSLGGLLGGLTGSSIGSDASDTSRSIRGLSPEAEQYAKSAGTPLECQKSLDRILTAETASVEIERFLQQGRIGEYAE